MCLNSIHSCFTAMNPFTKNPSRPPSLPFSSPIGLQTFKVKDVDHLGLKSSHFSVVSEVADLNLNQENDALRL